MWNQFWIPVLIPTLIIKSNCDTNKTESDIFIRDGGHVERDYNEDPLASRSSITELTTTTQMTTTTESTPTKIFEETSVSDNVFFIPNNGVPVRREEDEYENRDVKLKDIMMMKTVNDAMNSNFHVDKGNDAPNEDIVFISGKNRDQDKITKTGVNARRNDHYNQIETTDEEVIPEPKLNCNDLDCNNTISSICGTKLINNEWRFRLFMNDCYFRKVNCGLKYEINRYKQVTLDKCKSIGAHYIDRPFSFKPKSFILAKPLEDPEMSGRRSSSSRRSMTKNFDGQFCSHPCPVTCPDDYDPECAISSTGQKRVFANHCKLDHNSCFYNVVWHRRPLAECVGGKKADMRQNRGFIGWMQRVGIVDNKGRLVLD